MNRKERDRYFSFIGGVTNDIQIWGQYETLVDFIFENFPKLNRRFDEISLPTLFMVSHAVELGLKENIKFFRQYHESNHFTHYANWILLIKSHNLKNLSKEFKIGFMKLHRKVQGKENEKTEFLSYYSDLEKLIEILDRGTETYRYSLKLDNTGNESKKSINPEKEVDFLEIQELFLRVKILFLGVSNELAKYTDYIDYKKGNPTYSKGKGYLFCQKLHYPYLDRLKEQLTEHFTLISDDLWLDESTGEKFEIQVWDKHIYIIAI